MFRNSLAQTSRSIQRSVFCTKYFSMICQKLGGALPLQLGSYWAPTRAPKCTCSNQIFPKFLPKVRACFFDDLRVRWVVPWLPPKPLILPLLSTYPVICIFFMYNYFFVTNHTNPSRRFTFNSYLLRYSKHNVISIIPVVNAIDLW